MWQAGQGGTHLAFLLVGEYPQSPQHTINCVATLPFGAKKTQE